MTGVPPYTPRCEHRLPGLGALPAYDGRRECGLGLRARRVPQPDIERRVADALEAGAAHRLRPASRAQLSGGQRQRVALARAIVNLPALLLLDEPLGALDLKLRREMQVELKRIQQEIGTTFLFVTHDQGEALAMSDQIAVMNQGRIEQIASPQVLYDRPATKFVAGFIGHANLIPVGCAFRFLRRRAGSLRPTDRFMRRNETGWRQRCPDGPVRA